MLTLYHERDPIEGLAARVEGGVAVIADSRKDVGRLVSFCWSVSQQSQQAYDVPDAERPHERRLRMLFGRLIAEIDGAGPEMPAFHPQESPELHHLLEKLHGPIGEDSVGWQAGNVDPFESLALALAGVWDSWDEQADETRQGGPVALQLMLALATPSRARAPAVELRFAESRAALTIEPGSVVAGLTFATLIKGTHWCAVLVAKGARHLWRRPAAAARALVESTRERAKATAREPFPRLDDLGPRDHAKLQGSQAVIVLVHGLLSTDLGTFDGFIERLVATHPVAVRGALQEYADLGPKERDVVRPIIDALSRRLDGLDRGTIEALKDMVVESDGASLRKLVGNTFGIVGWPHNTLTSIEENGSSLADLIRRTFTPDGPRLVFVCHSRGGLVARAATHALLDLDDAWATALIDCITFGTPHEGAPLAQHSARELAVYLLMLQATRRGASLLDALVYLDANTAEGIEQLSPAETTTESREQAYLSRLFAMERGLQGKLGRRVPPIVAIGGEVNAAILNSWRRRAASAFLGFQMGDLKHDLVVPLASSTSSRIVPEIRTKTRSDHFGYFGDDQTKEAHFDMILGRLWSEVDLAAAVRRRPARPRGIDIRYEEGWIEIGDVHLERRSAWAGGARERPTAPPILQDAPFAPEMVVIPPGEFVMGSSDDEEGRFPHEGPQHTVRIAYRFAVGRYPVSFEEYDRFVAATGGRRPDDEGWGRGRRPVIDVSWEDAQAYVAWLSQETGKPYRLLSESEWEYAARAGTTTRYSWGDDITPEHANYGPNVGMTTEAGSYPPNPWGLYDMHGNVWEWCEDCWSDSYEGAPTDGSARTSGDCSLRVLRGGSWYNDPRLVRSASRVGNDLGFRHYYTGFRVARTLR